MKARKHIKFSLVVMFTPLLFSICGGPEQVQEVLRPVRYMTAAPTQGSFARTFAGVAQAGTESKLSFRVPGIIRSVAIEVGDRVRSGQLIAELDPNDYELRLQQTEASLLQGRAQARNADASYERIRALYEKRSASQSDLDSARMAFEAAGASVQALEKQKELSRMQLSYTKLTAPVDGAIAEVNVEVNENVQAGMPVVLLTSGTQIEVRVSIPENLISLIEEEKEVSIDFDAIPDKRFPGRVSEVGVKSTGMATTFPVILQLIQVDSAIRAGMAASAEFRFQIDDDRVRFLVPSEAVGEDREGRFVFLVEASAGQPGQGIDRRRSVMVGEMTEYGMEIFEGLEDGDMVVTAGISQIIDGQTVKIQ